MRMYVPAPDLTRPMGSTVPFVRISTADNVCSADAYTVTFPSKENQYVPALQLTFTDDEADEFLEAFATARLARQRKQEETYEALHAKFGGTWDNALADRTDPDNDFPEFPAPGDDDAPEWTL